MVRSRRVVATLAGAATVGLVAVFLGIVPAASAQTVTTVSTGTMKEVVISASLVAHSDKTADFKAVIMNVGSAVVVINNVDLYGLYHPAYQGARIYPGSNLTTTDKFYDGLVEQGTGYQFVVSFTIPNQDVRVISVTVDATGDQIAGIQGVPEMPFQLISVVAITVVITASYLIVKHRTAGRPDHR